VFAFLKLAGVPFTHQHIFDASAAPRDQLPHIDDDGEAIGDSDAIIAHLIRKYRLTIDDGLTATQRDSDVMIARLLDDLYWVMSYSRWKDDQFWPVFRDALRREHPGLTEAGLQKAREFNFLRYHYQGIGRFAPAAAYARGLADLRVLADRSRPAAMPPSTASSPTFISTRSTPRSGTSSRHTLISSGIAPPSMPRSVRPRRRERAQPAARRPRQPAARQDLGRCVRYS
jgi:hypothetical protein